jgi:glycosyltransferase involved in cell wall biosynthesis
MNKIAINASRVRSGGGIVHLARILNHYSYNLKHFDEIHIWGYQGILDVIPRIQLFIKHISFEETKGIVYQIFWENYILPKELSKYGCQLLINLDAGSFCRFTPNITMSRDMLSYESGIMNKYFISISWLRLLILKYVQIWSLKNATKAVFLTHYAKYIIEKESNYSFNSIQIPHGIDQSDFEIIKKLDNFSEDFIEIVYVSNFDLYKNQDNVISAFKTLSKKYNNIRLHLVGAFSNKSFYEKCIKIADNDQKIFFHGSIVHSAILSYLNSADILLFASSCENMPNTLLEYMTAKKPILCSNKGPMPEVLGEWDYYFNPEDVISIVCNLERLLSNYKLWGDMSRIAFERVQKYSWKKSSDDLFNLAFEILNCK